MKRAIQIGGKLPKPVIEQTPAKQPDVRVAWTEPHAVRNVPGGSICDCGHEFSRHDEDGTDTECSECSCLRFEMTETYRVSTFHATGHPIRYSGTLRGPRGRSHVFGYGDELEKASMIDALARSLAPSSGIQALFDAKEAIRRVLDSSDNNEPLTRRRGSRRVIQCVGCGARVAEMRPGAVPRCLSCGRARWTAV
jgi:hypothetical protein